MASFPPLSYVCPMLWAEMRGDERERFCEKCSRHVVNLSMLTEGQRQILLKNSRPEELCVVYYRRMSGEYVTAEKPLVGTGTKRFIQATAATLAIGTAVVTVAGDPYADEKLDRAKNVVADKYFETKESVLACADRVAEALTGRPLREPVQVLMGMMVCPATVPASAPAPVSTPAATPAPELAPATAPTETTATETTAKA